MSKVFLVNIGVNTSESSRARSPIFEDGSFVFVPYSYHETGSDGYARHANDSKPFVRNLHDRNIHDDPDWRNLTYGDCCGRKSPRGLALRRAVENDIFLFWSLLWRNNGKDWSAFTGEKRWCFIGALRVREILRPGQSPDDASPSRRARAANNAHFWGDKLEQDHHVFIGCTKHSRRFNKAVDMQMQKKNGLFYKTIRSADEKPLSLDGQPKWWTSTRACRPVWDMNNPEQHSRAIVVKDEILKQTGFDIFRELPTRS